MNKKISTLLIALGATTVLNAGEVDNYLSIVAGNLSFNHTVYGDVDGEEQKYNGYSNTSNIGLEYTWMKEIAHSHVILGLSPRILLNDGDFLDGGTFDFSFLAGASFSRFKIYSNIGFAINSLSDYTVATGATYGLTARYDISKHFSAGLSYNFYALKIAEEDRTMNSDLSYTSNGLLGKVSFRF